MAMNPKLQARILAAYHKAREAAKATRGQTAENDYGFPWAVTAYGSDGRTLWVHERNDRPCVVRVRWQSTPQEIAAGAKPQIILGVATRRLIRDDRGELLKREIGQAVEAAKARYEEWLNPAEAGADEEVWSLERMLRFFTDQESGTGAVFSSERWRVENVGTFPVDTTKRTHVAELARLIGLSTDIRQIRQARTRKSYLTLAKESTDGEGYRKAEMVLSTLYAAANHCRRMEAPGFPEDSIRAPHKWRKRLKEEWAKATGVAAKPRRPRYSEAEASLIVRRIDEADPRLRMALLIGLGYRVLQVAENAKRSQLTPEGEFGQRLKIMDQKKGEPTLIDLTPRQQRVLSECMQTGYLADLEAAYVAGRIKDYYLVPGERLRDGRAQLQWAARPMGRRRLSRLMTTFEAAIGVPHVDGRLFHGLRRALEKAVGEETDDEAVRDVAGAWKIGSGTRNSTYTDPEDEDRRAAAAHARAAAIERLAAPLTPAARVEELAAAARSLAERVAAVGAGNLEALMKFASEAAQGLVTALEQAAIAAAELKDSEW